MKPLVFVTCIVCHFLSACCSFERCAEKFGDTVQDSVQVDTILYIQSIAPKDSLQFSIQIDSFLMMRPLDTLKFKQGKAEARIYKDEHNNYLQADIDCLPDTIVKQVPVRLDLPCPPSVMLGDKPDPWWLMWWYRIATTVTAIVVIRFLIIRIFKI